MAIQLRTDNRKRRLTQLGGDTPPDIQGAWETGASLQGGYGVSLQRLQPQTSRANDATGAGWSHNGNKLQPANAPVEVNALRSTKQAKLGGYNPKPKNTSKSAAIGAAIGAAADALRPKRRPGLQKLQPKARKALPTNLKMKKKI